MWLITSTTRFQIQISRPLPTPSGTAVVVSVHSVFFLFTACSFCSQVDEEAQHKHEAQTALLTSFCGGSSSRVLEPGQYFGEVAVLLPHCDTVGTATAMENVTLLRFDKDIRISRQKPHV